MKTRFLIYGQWTSGGTFQTLPRIETIEAARAELNRNREYRASGHWMPGSESICRVTVDDKDKVTGVLEHYEN